MNAKNFKFLFLLILVCLITFGLTVSLQSILAAWVAPTAAPPAGNADAPINVGFLSQSKSGPLNVNTNGIADTGLNVIGNIDIPADSGYMQGGVTILKTTGVANASVYLGEDAGISDTSGAENTFLGLIRNIWFWPKMRYN